MEGSWGGKGGDCRCWMRKLLKAHDVSNGWVLQSGYPESIKNNKLIYISPPSLHWILAHRALSTGRCESTAVFATLLGRTVHCLDLRLAFSLRSYWTISRRLLSPRCPRKPNHTPTARPQFPPPPLESFLRPPTLCFPSPESISYRPTPTPEAV